MASYQFDFENRIKEPKDVFNLINRFRVSSYRDYCIQNKSYYNGENWTILHLPDRTYWSDRIVTDRNGTPILNGNGQPQRVNQLVKNPFVANNRIAYGIFHDIVSQKVNTLNNEAPTINTESENALSEKFRKQLGYAYKVASTEASICGRAFIYEDIEGNLTVFDTVNSIPFYDNVTGVLRALIRFIEILGEFNYSKRSMVAEVYTEEGLTIYEKVGMKIEVKQKLTAYKFKTKSSAVFSEIKNIGMSSLPIIEFRNNREAKSDLTPSLRAKIDTIDLVESGFINNIEDFSDVFWVIKSQMGGGMSEDDYTDFFANINKTKRIFAESATPEQFSIPHEARNKAVELLKQQIVEESGVIDSTGLVATQLTTTAIKAATMKLEQRVSDFEWFENEALERTIELYKEYHNEEFDFTIDFTKLLINNTTETIDNLVKIRNDISQETMLKQLQRLNIVDDWEKEMERIQNERSSSFSLISDDEEE